MLLREPVPTIDPFSIRTVTMRIQRQWDDAPSLAAMGPHRR